MAATQYPPKPEIENSGPVPVVIKPGDERASDRHDVPPPETVNLSQEDESEQSQTFADAALHDGNDIGLSDTTKVSSGVEGDDVQDLVDHMNAMVASGRIDMDAYRGERNDDDEEGSLGPAAARE